MKRFISAVLCFAILCSLPGVVSAADTEVTEPDKEISILLDLGFLDKYVPGADVTREMVKESLDVVYGADSYRRYLEERDMQQPILYGQVLMILVDLAGYAPFINIYGYDKNDPADYYKVAVKAGITKDNFGDFKKPISVENYAKLLYTTLCDVNLLKATYKANGQTEYKVDKTATLFESVLDITHREGIVTGVGKTSLSSVAEEENDRIAIDGKWYTVKMNRDIVGYIGMRAEVYFGGEDNDVIAIAENKNANKVITVRSCDIDMSNTGIYSLRYTDKNGKRRTAAIDKKADFIYNKRLLQSFKADDLKLSDCDYKLIDNNGDSKFDVILADKYDYFMAETVIENDKRIVDTNNNVYELEDYITDGGTVRNADGDIIELGDISSYNIVSYAKSRDGEYTDFIVSGNKVSGIFEKTKENHKFVTVSGTEYECLSAYYQHLNDFDKVSLGDEVEAYLDFNGYIADMKKVSGAVRAGYVMGAAEQSFGTYNLRLLNEEGKIETLETEENVWLDGVRVKAEQLGSSPLFSNGEFVPQLIEYKRQKSGRIFYIDTAENKIGLGSADNEGFTLDYDSEKDAKLRVINLNGQKILGSKYMLTTDAKVFGVHLTDDRYCYVQDGTSLPLQSSLNIKLYNVNKNCVPQYMVINLGDNLGKWVDKWELTYIADEVYQEYDESEGMVKYKLKYYDGSGKEYSAFIQDEELRTPSGNAMYPSAADNPKANQINWTRNNKFRPIKIKDIKRGTIFQFNADENGIYTFAIQHMPEIDNKEIIFEGTNDTTGSDYGTTKYMFNAGSLVSYGKVLRKTPGGIIINNYPTTSEMTAEAELASSTFPQAEWNRTIPLSAGDFVWFYDKSEDKLYAGTAAEILAGDMIFMHRRTTNIITTVIYRD